MPGDDVGVRGQRDVELLGAERPHDEDALREPGGAKRLRLARRRHAQPVRAAGHRRARRGDRAVAVPVGLDHGGQPRALRQLALQPGAVALDRRQVDRGRCADGHT